MSDIHDIRPGAPAIMDAVPRAQLDDIDLRILGRLQEQARISNVELADEIVALWLTTTFLGGRHQRRVDQISAVERKS